ncbi:MAG: hypothetical protein ACOC36_07055, partial [Fibrobacterota bacterium]
MSETSGAAYTLESLDQLQSSALAELEKIRSEEDAEQFSIKYLGKKGILRDLMKSLGSIAPEKRKQFGARANELRTVLESKFN